MERSCSRYDLANPGYVEGWVKDHVALVDGERIGEWVERLCESPGEIESEPMVGPFAIYGYRTTLIEDQDVDVVFVFVENSCEVYIRRLTHLSEIDDERDSLPFPEFREPPP